MTPIFTLARNEVSRWHKLVAAGQAFDVRTRQFQRVSRSSTLPQIFVVRHDWLKVLEDVIDETTEFRLPYACNLFEFRVSFRGGVVPGFAGDHTVIVDPGTTDDGIITANLKTFVEARDGRWIALDCSLERAAQCASKGIDTQTALAAWLFRQICAICVALEAQVAEHEVVRAPAALNAKRARSGKPPLTDFHVVDLARRHRAAADAPPRESSCGRKVRLHFRRGHWRHFDTHKTWVTWALVGNPDLGWVDKEYRI